MGLTAAEIAKLAFSGVIQSGPGALSKVGFEKAKQLWQAIRAKFQGNPIAEETLDEAQKEQSPQFCGAGFDIYF